MKKLTGFLLSILTLVALTTLFSAHASATQQPADQCDQVTTYLLPEGNEVHDNRVTVDFHHFGAKHNAIIDVIAQPGFQVTEVDLSVGVDQQTAVVYTYTTGDLVSFNPPGDEDIEYTQVKVKKICTTPTPTPVDNDCDADDPCVTPTEAPTPTAPPAGHGDGLSDGRSDGLSSCPSCTQAPQGEVLGASTMAGTGSLDAKLMKLYIIVGMFLLLSGYASFSKEKRYN